MAFFGVTIEEIEKIYPHPNADNLCLCKLKDMGFQFVIPKNKYVVGQSVLYFPVDSLLPFELMVKMNLVRERRKDGQVVLDENGNPVIEGVLFNKEKNRVKTVRIRGEISQGIIASTDLLERCDSKDSEVITEFLGVTKYSIEEKEFKQQKNSPAWFRPLPEELSVYDIEGSERNKRAVEKMMDMKVCITEKMEGMNFSATYRPKTGEFFINSRKHSILPEDQGCDHLFWKWVQKHNFKETMISLCDFECDSVTFYGEFIGPKVQGNIYKLEDNTVLFFDVKVDRKFLSVRDKMRMFDSLVSRGFGVVPTLYYDMTLNNILGFDAGYRGCAGELSIPEYSNGKSMLNTSVMREGIVITPMEEQWDDKIGRLILKQRSPEYLAKSSL